MSCDSKSVIPKCSESDRMAWQFQIVGLGRWLLRLLSRFFEAYEDLEHYVHGGSQSGRLSVRN